MMQFFVCIAAGAFIGAFAGNVAYGFVKLYFDRRVESKAITRALRTG